MGESFETMLTGGHSNSLGRTVDVVDIVLSDRRKLDNLYQCYFSDDDVVRLRTSSAMKRVTQEHPDWTMDYISGLQSEIAGIDQASTQWTLAKLFDLTRDLMSSEQKARSIEIMQRNIVHHDDWIVLQNAMQMLADWSDEFPHLKQWLLPHLQRLSNDRRKSVAGRSRKLLKTLS